jgi:hypothetical protein
MNEKPIIFSGPMVRAILDGRKTQTRRIVKPQPRYNEDGLAIHMDKGSPYSVGDTLWVRETTHVVDRWFDGKDDAVIAAYSADSATVELVDRWPWKRDTLPSIHMPRGFCRLFLRVTALRVERLQEICYADVRAEGILVPGDDGSWSRTGFIELWDSLNAKRAPWSSNPWVWVIEFERIEP